jgi:hypothetical protein
MSQVNRLSDGRLSAELLLKGDTPVAEASRQACPDGGGGRGLVGLVFGGCRKRTTEQEEE